MKVVDDEVPVSEATEFLLSCKGKVIRNLFRTNPEPFEEKNLGGFDTSRFFSVAYGAFLMELSDGTLFGIGTQDSSASLTIWLERDTVGNFKYNIFNRADTYFIDAKNEIFVDQRIRNLLAQRISAFKIYKRKPRNVSYQFLPNDCILSIQTESGAELFVVLQLTPSLEDMAIIMKNDFPDKSWDEVLSSSIEI